MEYIYTRFYVYPATYETWKDSKKDDIQQWLKDQQIILLCMNCHALVHEYLEPAFIRTDGVA